ncbi:uncharacterized protein LOC120631614 [Pararge aegeria]|uniref:uncharacterized protein LOC120631614 n=1 Tax=Pararge aegeria TaxID=116150 RepID=UPI0019CFFAA7|nr:uncharacterized protein LOC120631614 [Pararge aegeria]
MLEFSTCCFCVPLRIGCLILGYLHLVAASVLTIITILTLTAVGAVVANSDIQVNQSVVDALIAISVIVLLLLVILLPASIMFVVGLHKERRLYVKIYLIYYLIFTILYFIMFIVRCSTLPPDLSYTLTTLAEILLSVYFLLVIRSHWVAMDGSNFNSSQRV